MELVIAGPAASDLSQIFDHIAVDNPAAAERVYRAITTSVMRLREFPGIGHHGRIAGTRELSVSSLPYVVVYRVQREVVTVIAVFHSARDLSRALHERLKYPD
jgi:toxin ParE1/3/4